MTVNTTPFTSYTELKTTPRSVYSKKIKVTENLVAPWLSPFDGSGVVEPTG